MLETALTDRLATLATNIYPVAAPLGYSTPAVVYNRISTDSADDLDGSGDNGWIMVQVDVYAPEFAAALALATTIRTRFASWQDADVNSVALHDVRNIIDDTTTTRLYRVSQDFLLFAPL